MVPVVTAYLALLAPFSAHLVRTGSLGWRGVAFLVVNIGAVGLIAAVPTQNNTIGVVRWVGGHPGYGALWSVRVSAEPYPIGYTAGPTPPLHETPAPPADNIDPESCEDVMAIRSDFLAELREDLTAWEEVAAFKPGLPERVVIMINPRHNTRRNPVHLFVPVGCGEDS